LTGEKNGRKTGRRLNTVAKSAKEIKIKQLIYENRLFDISASFD
jgi:hypothetical protein